MTLPIPPPLSDQDIIAHYTTLDACCEHIVPSGKIRFSPIARSNDPLENRKVILGAYHDENKGITTAKLQQEFSRIALHQTKILCFTDVQNSKKLDYCFNRPRMWAQYGDKHRGVALIFRKSEICKLVNAQFVNSYCNSISYANFPGLSPFIHKTDFRADSRSTMEDYVKSHVETLFFRKHPDWGAEFEFRSILINSTHTNYEFLDFGESLLGIVLGCETPDAYVEAVKSVSQVPIYKLNFSPMEGVMWPIQVRFA